MMPCACLLTARCCVHERSQAKRDVWSSSAQWLPSASVSSVRAPHLLMFLCLCRGNSSHSSGGGGDSQTSGSVSNNSANPPSGGGRSEGWMHGGGGGSASSSFSPSLSTSSQQYYFRISPFCLLAFHFRLQRIEQQVEEKRISAETRDIFYCPICRTQYDAMEAQLLDIDPHDAHFLCKFCREKLEHEVSLFNQSNRHTAGGREEKKGVEGDGPIERRQRKDEKSSSPRE